MESLCHCIFSFNGNPPPRARVVVREHNRTLATTVRLYKMLPLDVRVHDLKSCLGAGTISRGVIALLAISGGAYLAVSGVDIAIELNARLVLVRQLLQCSRVTVAHLPMPHVGVYLGRWISTVSRLTSSTMTFTTYIRGIAVDMRKALFPWRRAGGVDSRQHFTPFSAKAPTERMFAPTMRTSRTSSATVMI